jgi:hypothetical protein
LEWAFFTEGSYIAPNEALREEKFGMKVSPLWLQFKTQRSVILLRMPQILSCIHTDEQYEDNGAPIGGHPGVLPRAEVVKEANFTRAT